MSSKKLANPPAARGLSNWLDKQMGWYSPSDSRVRGAIHGVWHTGAGICTFNSREFSRAGEQFSNVTRPRTPPPVQYIDTPVNVDIPGRPDVTSKGTHMA